MDSNYRNDNNRNNNQINRPRRSVNVDVAKARRDSGYVDVMTGKRLDGRVQVPVDRRRQEQRSGQRAVTSGKTGSQRPAGREVRRRPEDEPAGREVRRRPDNKPVTRKEQKLREKKRREQEKKRRQQEERQRKKPTPEEIERQKRRREEKLKIRQERRQKAVKVLKILLKILVVLLVIAAVAFLYLYNCYKLKKITVTGTDHYTDQEMVDIVSGGKDYGNTLLFLIENRLHPVEDVTFVDKIDVEYVDRNTVSITIYEKAMAGCIKYDDQYAYFDGDGIVLEISGEKLADVPCIEGLLSDSVAQGEKLSVGNEKLFQGILTMTQLIYKNDIQIDKITYDKKSNLILHKGGIKIVIGGSDNLESKFMNLDSILEKLDGKKGTLDMSDYTSSNGSAIFKENK